MRNTFRHLAARAAELLTMIATWETVAAIEIGMLAGVLLAWWLVMR